MPRLRKNRFKLGRWYESKADVRSHYGQYWKGILLKGDELGIIYNYRGARRVHYGDYFDYRAGHISYLGEGLADKGDQTLNARNAALVEAADSDRPVQVFLDCGDLFKPKRILCAGYWAVTSYSFDYLPAERRRVYRFQLDPRDPEPLEFLRFTFGAVGDNPAFEADLRKFANARTKLYAAHPDVMRARDNVIGEIGEYFAIKCFNESAGDNHLVRLTGAFKDIDAIRIGSGKRYAIKTVGNYPSTTSNIWSADLEQAVDYFLICHIDPKKLTPKFVADVSIRKAMASIKPDKYQGSKKLKVDRDLIRLGAFHLGNKRDWV